MSSAVFVYDCISIRTLQKALIRTIIATNSVYTILLRNLSIPNNIYYILVFPNDTKSCPLIILIYQQLISQFFQHQCHKTNICIFNSQQNSIEYFSNSNTIALIYRGIYDGNTYWQIVSTVFIRISFVLSEFY